MRPRLIRLIAMATLLAASFGKVFGQQIRRTFPVLLAEPLILHVELEQGDLQIAYARDAEVSVTVLAESNPDSAPDNEFLAKLFLIEKNDNRLEIRDAPGASSPGTSLTYRIDVPYQTVIYASLQYGKARISGVMGPVNVDVNVGDVEVSRISLAATARTEMGNLSFKAVGGRIEARTSQGNIECQRAPQGIDARTHYGDISLAVVGPSTATVQTGGGRIDAAGVRGALLASASSGDISVRAVPHDDWQLSSLSGTIRIELPHGARFELDAATNRGEMVIGRDDLKKPARGVRRLNQKVNGGGKHIEVRTETGRIFVS